MKFVNAKTASDHWDLVVIGSGFGSMFFLHNYLKDRPKDRVLMLEMGAYQSSEWQAENKKNSNIPQSRVFSNKNEKEWDFTIGLGGSSNCWWALSPRLHPSDFKIFSEAGVGADWPIGYDDLVSHFRDAERIMGVAGPDNLDNSFPNTGTYPQPAHRLTTADEMIIAGGDPNHYAIPTAKASRSDGIRNRCCSNATCNVCPVAAKFMGIDEMQSVFEHPSVFISLNSQVTHIESKAGMATGVVFSHDKKSFSATGDLIVLGANAIQSPFIMLKSGIGGYGVGRFFGEKMLAEVEVLLDGLDHFDGGTSTTGFNLSLLENRDRASHAASVVYFNNWFKPGLRLEPGRWRQTLPLTIYVEEILDEDNGVYDEGADLPAVYFNGFSEYCNKGLQAALDYLPKMLKALPVEEIQYKGLLPTLGHLQGTLRMGTSISNSVVDKNLLHHELRNLVVVGTSVFPTTGSVNPTLTAAALSLRAAKELTSSQSREL